MGRLSRAIRRATRRIKSEAERAVDKAQEERNRAIQKAKEESERKLRTIEKELERTQELAEEHGPLKLKLILASTRGKGELEDTLSDLDTLFRNDPLEFAETVTDTKLAAETTADLIPEFQRQRERLRDNLKRINNQINDEFKRNPEIYIGIVALALSAVLTPAAGGYFYSLGLGTLASSSLGGAVAGGVVGGAGSVGVAAAKGEQDTGKLLDIAAKGATTGATTGAAGGLVKGAKLLDKAGFPLSPIEQGAVEAGAEVGKTAAKGGDSDDLSKAALRGAAQSAIGQNIEFESQAAQLAVERGLSTSVEGLQAKADSEQVGAAVTLATFSGAVEGGFQDVGILDLPPKAPTGGAAGEGSVMQEAAFMTASGLPLGTVAGEMAKEADPSLTSEILQFGRELLGQSAAQIIVALAVQPIANLFHIGQPNRPVTQQEHFEYNQKLRQLQGEILDIEAVTKNTPQETGGEGFIPQDFLIPKPKKLSNTSKFLLTSGLFLAIIPDTREFILSKLRRA